MDQKKLSEHVKGDVVILTNPNHAPRRVTITAKGKKWIHVEDWSLSFNTNTGWSKDSNGPSSQLLTVAEYDLRVRMNNMDKALRELGVDVRTKNQETVLTIVYEVLKEKGLLK